MTRPFALLPLLLPLSGCFLDELTWEEAKAALEEGASAGRVETFTGGVVEISTGFTLGQAAEDAAEELRGFLESQVPCSTVTRSGFTVTMDFGTLDDQCTWNGRTYAGVTRMTLRSVEDGQAVVEHEWVGMTDGLITLDGGAEVTWDGVARTRQVVHEVRWTDETGAVREGSGDRIQRLLDEDQGLQGGIQVDGERSWTGPTGDYLLDIAAVEMRPQDPVPQEGEYQLTIPSGKTATLAFHRLDADTIEVVLSGGRQDHVWHITSQGVEYQD